MASRHCELYMYTPSLPLAAVAVITFSSLASVLCFRMIQTKTWSSIFFVLGAIFQASGYTARLFSTLDTCNRAAYGAQSVLLLLGPTLIMMSVDMMQTKFACALDAEKHCFIPIKWQRPLYLGTNTVLIFLQAIGGIMVVASTSTATVAVGTKMTIAIYVAQTLFWGLVFADNIFMMFRLSGQPTEASKDSLTNWKMWNQLFGLSTGIIAFGRNVMRLTMAGQVAFLVENEWPSYAFDGYQMIIVLSAWEIWYLPERCETIRGRRSYRSLTRLENIRHSPV
ncbi:hypothetical protein N7462_008063 [Penicillium macrosclerotiorum]|uniref:uncharacterized protein n=1 Tax=Penicillium macrosclerotiorum TaxID=303699 RepID=UPI002549126E|nr:uncharacterized protein N7462_008063 [Penicillium macrosclerotiorum]KAJ5679819.1 hypothetical protein N7462_008063 [Penicillium macrosclerotiorum]